MGVKQLYVGAVMALMSMIVLAEDKPWTSVNYMQETNQLSVEARQFSLQGVLARISYLSGVEISMDPTVERPVTIMFSGQPLEHGLRRLTRNMNSVFVYSQQLARKNEKPVLIGMQLLPKGQQSSENLQPVLPLENEALKRGVPEVPVGPLFSADLAERRWQERIATLDPEVRKRLKKQTDAINKKRQARKKKREKRLAKVRERHERDRKQREAEIAEQKAFRKEMNERYGFN